MNEERDDRIARAREQGLTLMQISERFGLGYARVSHILVERGLGVRTSRITQENRDRIVRMLREQAGPTRYIAEACGVTSKTVTRLARVNGIELVRENVKQPIDHPEAEAALCAGESQVSVRKRFGLSDGRTRKLAAKVAPAPISLREQYPSVAAKLRYGWTQERIASHYGVSRYIVRRVAEAPEPVAEPHVPPPEWDESLTQPEHFRRISDTNDPVLRTALVGEYQRRYGP